MTAPLREASVRRVAPPGGVLRAAAALAGVTLVTVNPAYQAGELAHVLGHFSARAIFVAEDHRGSSLPAILATVRGRLPELREVIPFGAWDLFCASGRPGRLPTVDPGAPAQVLYTSGTTGRPKAAVLTHRGLTNNARLAAESHRDASRRDRGPRHAAVPRRRLDAAGAERMPGRRTTARSVK